MADAQRTNAEDLKRGNQTEKNIFETFGFYSVQDLTAEEKRPPAFIIENMVPEGLTFLSGAPKTRKSFLSLQMAIAVSTGLPFFGCKTLKSEVAYFDLEGSKSRISTRTANMTVRIPKEVHITNRVKDKLGKGLEKKIQLLHQERPDIRFYIIDTFGRARANIKTSSANAYFGDVELLEPLQSMALEEHIAVLLVHHDKKGAGFMADSFERLSGTMGISGSADSVLNLITEGKRFDGKATLEYTPRDAKGGELKLSFDDRFCEWVSIPDSEGDLTGNPVCRWIIENAPPKRKEGKFFSYADCFEGAFRTFSDSPSDEIRKQVEANRDTLFSKYGIGVQVGVMSHERRGVRIINLL